MGIAHGTVSFAVFRVRIRKVFSFFFSFSKFLSLVSFFRVKVRVRVSVRVRIKVKVRLSIVRELVLSLTRLSFPLHNWTNYVALIKK